MELFLHFRDIYKLFLANAGRLTLTDHGLYFETHRVVAYDKPKVYDFTDDLKHSIKADLTGPLGARLFDKALTYKSTSL